LIFTTGRLKRASPPLIPPDALELGGPVADPLPQALILTAIVISFGVTAFALVLARQTYLIVGTNDMDTLRETDLQPQYHPEQHPAEED